jgi:hypothetical protein
MGSNVVTSSVAGPFAVLTDARQIRALARLTARIPHIGAYPHLSAIPRRSTPHQKAKSQRERDKRRLDRTQEVGGSNPPSPDDEESLQTRHFGVRGSVRTRAWADVTGR